MSKSSVPPRTTWQPRSVDWVIRVLIKRWKFIVCVAASIIAALFIALLIRGPVYEAKARVLIKLGRETASAVSLSEQRTMVQAKRPEDVATEIQNAGIERVRIRSVLTCDY